MSITAKEEARLVEWMVEQLSSVGHVQADVDSLSVPVATFRKVARAAGRELQRPVRTWSAVHLVGAGLQDWPANKAEEETQMRLLRAGTESVPPPCWEALAGRPSDNVGASSPARPHSVSSSSRLDLDREP